MAAVLRGVAGALTLTALVDPAAWGAATVPGADEGTDTRPNIVLFLSDDMGWGQPGFNGGTEVTTPNMDRIANEGVKLTQFYVQPRCSPTRAALLTGRYPWKNGMELRPGYDDSQGMPTGERTLADALRDAGYATWIVGKWHLGQWHSEHLPLQRGFDHHYGHYSAAIDSFTHRRVTILDWHRNGRPVVETGYSTFLLADEAVRLVERHDGSRPFFLYVPFNAVHNPNQAPQEYVDAHGHLDHPEQRGQLKAMDDAIGQVIDALERKGVFDDTLVMFLNDNGGPVSAGWNRPYRQKKSSYYEGGIRVPAVLRWPGQILAGSESDALLHVVDLFPTFARLAGADTAAGLPLDGIDAWMVIAEGAESPRTEVVHARDVIRMGDWKLIEENAAFADERQEHPAQLYNIRDDPYEETDLSASEPDRMDELRARLAYHVQFAREPEPAQRIPDHPPVVYGADENAAFGAEVQNAWRELKAGNSGPVLLRVEASGTSARLFFDETLAADSIPSPEAFTVVLNPGYRSTEVTHAALTGSEVVLTLTQAAVGGDTVGLTYDVPETGAIRDTDDLAAVGVTWMTGPAETPSTLSVEEVEASEDAGALGFRVELNPASDTDVTVDYQTSDVPSADGARAGLDYTAVSGTLTFPAGTAGPQEVLVPATDDGVDEPDREFFSFILRNATNASLAGGVSALRVRGTIVDNDTSSDGTEGGGDPGSGSGGGGGGGSGSGTPPPPTEPEPRPEPPTAMFEPDAGCGNGLCRALTGVAVTLTDTSTGSVRSRNWDFGDGTRSRSRQVDHAWSEPGFYDVTLRVSDGVTESTASATFLVEASEPAGSCATDAWTRCLRDSRYSVQVQWWTRDGLSGPGTMVHEGTNDSGLFTFLDPDNWEALVKVLDGCTGNGHVWVFGALTTDLGYLIHVTDTVTGTVREYRNEQGLAALAITDVTAFPKGCSQAGASF